MELFVHGIILYLLPVFIRRIVYGNHEENTWISPDVTVFVPRGKFMIEYVRPKWVPIDEKGEAIIPESQNLTEEEIDYEKYYSLQVKEGGVQQRDINGNPIWTDPLNNRVLLSHIAVYTWLDLFKFCINFPLFMIKFYRFCQYDDEWIAPDPTIITPTGKQDAAWARPKWIGEEELEEKEKNGKGEEKDEKS